MTGLNSGSTENIEPQIKGWIQAYFRTGNTDYLGNIYESCKQQIYYHCWRMVSHAENARDLASDTFVAAFRNIGQYDMRRPFYPWLRQIATNQCIDFIRKKKFISLKDLDHTPDKETPDPLSDHLNEDLRIRIRNTINRLKQPQRRCFCLFYIQEKSYKEIVQITGYPYQKVRSAIQNARRNFRRLYGKVDFEF
jgi:RNA polymerase sigma factor (sigma-70 family)